MEETPFMKEFPFYKTDFYRTKDNEDIFCVREHELNMQMYTNKESRVQYQRMAQFNEANNIKYGLDIEHECHFLRQGVIQASGRFFQLVYAAMDEHMFMDKHYPPEDELQKNKIIKYAIVSHSWGQLLEVSAYFGVDFKQWRTSTEGYQQYKQANILKEAKALRTKQVLRQTIGEISKGRILPRVPASASYNGPNQPPFEFSDSRPMVRLNEDIQ